MDDERYDFVNDRIDHCVTEHDALVERVAALESKREAKHSRTLEWIVIVLIVVEIVVAVMEWRHA